ncbi:PaaX family transcriptional regulator C-terminal domain-containing protein [Actinomadura litoris]|uniref:PaaX family transcriptional regulator C-terminal domain-containing protein n=1 Tax=Actinomadura litoris TaxID=2678616 RepID=UPI003559026D
MRVQIPPRPLGATDESRSPTVTKRPRSWQASGSLSFVIAGADGSAAEAGRAAWCWRLDEIAGDYRAFVARCGEGLADADGAEATRVRIGLVHEDREFPLRDPDLLTGRPTHPPVLPGGLLGSAGTRGPLVPATCRPVVAFPAPDRYHRV